MNDDDAVMIATLLKNAGIEYRFSLHGKLGDDNKPVYESVKVYAQGKSGDWVEMKSPGAAFGWMRENLR